MPYFPQLEVLVHLFQKVAEYEAEPHFNAKASAFANCASKMRSSASDFWTESILPECREVQLRRFSEGKWRRKPTRRSCNLPKASTRSVTPRGGFCSFTIKKRKTRAFNRDPPPRSPSREPGGGCLVSAQILFSDRDFVDIHVILYRQIGTHPPPPSLEQGRGAYEYEHISFDEICLMTKTTNS